MCVCVCMWKYAKSVDVLRGKESRLKIGGCLLKKTVDT